MKYCIHCGAEIYDEAVICIKCGRSMENQTPSVITSNHADNTMQTVIKIFLILGCIFQGWLLIPLAWCLPITISIFNRFRDQQPISTATKVCALLFVNLIAGICLLCMDDNQQ